MSFMANKRITAGRKAISRKPDLQPTHLLAIQNMVKLYRYQGREEAAQSLLKKRLPWIPHRRTFTRAWPCCSLKRRISRARSEFEKATQLEPRNVEILNGPGVVLMEMGESDRAMEAFDNCRLLAPDYDRPYLNMAVLYVNAGKADKAHDLLSEFLARQPGQRGDSPGIARSGRQEMTSSCANSGVRLRDWLMALSVFAAVATHLPRQAKRPDRLADRRKIQTAAGFQRRRRSGTTCAHRLFDGHK